MRLRTFLLVGIIFLAGFLRMYNISTNPPSLTWDEVAWGYNAYALGIDGKDEFGKFLPLDYLESFGDFKPPLYAYLTILPIKLLGLNEFATRFPSALFGTLSVLVTYFLIKEVFTHSKDVENYALATAFLLAISPWHINLSRAAFEANVASFFLICGVWQFLFSVRKRPWCLILSVFAFVLSFYTFNTARIIAPLLIAGLVFSFRKELIKYKKIVLISCTVGIILMLPVLPFMFSQQAKLRFNEVNIFSDISIIERTNYQITQNNNELWSKIVHNRRLAFTVEFLRHYLDNITPKFLFISGDGNPKFSTQDVGQLYLWEIPFILGGILLLFRKKESYWWIIPYWLVIGILPAATARETPHALRIETTLPTFQLITAYGLVGFLKYISDKKYKIFKLSVEYITCSLLFLLIISNFSYYVYGYYSFYPHDYSGEWQYGYKDAISYINKHYNEYDQIDFTDSLGRPYAYFLFYTQYDPKVFRKEAKIEREALGFVHVKSFDKYTFAKELSKLPTGTTNSRVLYVDTPQNVPAQAQIKEKFYLRNDQPSLVAYTL